MPIKLIVFVAFVLSRVGVFLLLLNKENQKKEYAQTISDSYTQTQNNEKHILTLLINANYNQKLIDSLHNSNFLKQEDIDKLYNATQSLCINSEAEFNNSNIKQEWSKSTNIVEKESEYSENDVYFIKIEINEKVDLKGFKHNAIQIDRIDSFNSLANQKLKVEISSRFSCKSYEKTEFYNR